jgi:enoyl-CoA hydratase
VFENKTKPTQALNALCDKLIAELNDATRKLDHSAEIGAIVITGDERAFAAGADIKEMAPRTHVENYTKNKFSEWADLTKIQTPVSYHLI